MIIRRFIRTTATASALTVLTAAACNSEEVPVAPVEPLGDLPTTCSDDPTEECAEPDPAAVPVNKEKDLGIVRVELVDADKGIVEMELEDDSPLFDLMQPGRVIYRHTSEKPLLRRIETVKRNGNLLVMGTTLARMRDAFKRVRIRRTVTVSSKKLATKPVMGAGLGQSSQELSWGCDVNIPMAKLPSNVGSIDVGLKDCGVELELSVDVHGDWGFSAGDFAEITATGTLTAGATAYLDAKGAVSANGSKTLFSFPIPTGVPGVVVDVKLIAGYSVVANAEIEAEAGFDYEGSLTAGVGYQVGDGFYTVWDPQKEFTKRGPTFEFDGSLAAEVYLKPHLGLSAFESLEGYIEAKTFASLTMSSDLEAMTTIAPGEIEVDSKLCYDLSVGIAPILGAELSALGLLKLAEFSFSPFVLETSLVNRCVANTHVEDTSCKEDSECAVTAECSAPDACSVPLCSSCKCVFKKIPDCCLEDADCDPDTDVGKGSAGIGGLITYACVSNQCVAQPLQGACNDDADCDDGIDASEDRCEESENGALPHCVHDFSGEHDETGLGCLANFQCGDGNPNTLDTCTSDGCVNMPIPACGGSCSDGDPSTSDACIDGECKHTSLNKVSGK